MRSHQAILQLQVIENTPKLWLEHLPKANPQSNKYTRGNVIIYGGYPITGAARLAARGAARAGAGLTTVLVPEIAFPIYAASLVSIMVKPFVSTDDYKSAIDDKRITAYLIGPGAGVNQQTREYTHLLLATGKPIVLDADAISVFQNDLPSLKQAIHSTCVMTPHEGEFSRLFGSIKIGNIQDRLQSVQQASKDSGSVIVLKGSETIICAPDGTTIINYNAPPTLATAGSGDVLAGIITGLLAQGMQATLAAAAGVWLHGECANQFGLCLIAEDLPDLLPKVLTKTMSALKPGSMT